MKKILLALFAFTALALTPTAKAEVITSPNFTLGVGLHDSTGDEEDTNFYGVLRLHILEVPGSAISLGLIGAGLSLDTSGEAQVVVAPVSFSLAHIISITPEYGFGLGDSSDKIGVSVGFGF